MNKAKTEEKKWETEKIIAGLDSLAYCNEDTTTGIFLREVIDFIYGQKQRIEELEGQNAFECGCVTELQKEIEKYKCVNKLLEMDIEDLHKEREKRVEEVYADFMKDYYIMRDELNACYDEIESLYDLGYRKIPENAVVLTREDYNRILSKERRVIDLESITNAEEKTRKETAERFAKKVARAICDNTYPYFDKDGKPVNIWNAVLGYDEIEEIAKELTEGV